MGIKLALKSKKIKNFQEIVEKLLEQLSQLRIKSVITIRRSKKGWWGDRFVLVQIGTSDHTAVSKVTAA